MPQVLGAAGEHGLASTRDRSPVRATRRASGGRSAGAAARLVLQALQALGERRALALQVLLPRAQRGRLRLGRADRGAQRLHAARGRLLAAQLGVDLGHHAARLAHLLLHLRAARAAAWEGRMHVKLVLGQGIMPTLSCMPWRVLPPPTCAHALTPQGGLRHGLPVFEALPNVRPASRARKPSGPGERREPQGGTLNRLLFAGLLGRAQERARLGHGVKARLQVAAAALRVGQAQSLALHRARRVPQPRLQLLRRLRAH